MQASKQLRSSFLKIWRKNKILLLLYIPICVDLILYIAAMCHIFKAVMLTTILCQEPSDLIFGGPHLPTRNILRKCFISFVHHRVASILLQNILYIFFS